MIIKNNSTRLIITLSIVLIIPFVQKQWFNLYLFNNNNISFHSILYYLSGIITPSLICFNSLNNFTYYQFSKNKINSKIIIKGKTLLVFVAISLIILSFLIVDYFYINFDFLTNLFFGGNKFQQTDIFQLSYLIFSVAILLIYKAPRIFAKKLILINFILISFYIWYLQIKNINIDDQFHISKYFVIDNMNLINVLILFTLEITYFIWSYLSYKNNLSDWIVQISHKSIMNNIFKIFIFYFFIFIYYSILS